MASGLTRNQRIAPVRIEQDVVQVDTVDNDVRILEASAQRWAGRKRA